MSALSEFLLSAIGLLPAAAAAVNVLAVLVLHVLDRFHQPRRFSWIAAVGGAFLSWLMLFLSVIRLPHVLPWIFPASPSAISILPVFVYDGVSWPYAFAVGTLTLAVLLTAPTREKEGKPVRLGAELVIGAAGILVVAAATPLSLVMSWTFLDGMEVLIWFFQTRSPEVRRQVVSAYAFRTLAVLLLLWQMADTQMGGVDMGMLDLAPQMSVYFLVAVTIRLGVYPLFIFPTQGEHLRQGLTTLMRMVNAAAALVVLGRVAGLTTSPVVTSGLFLLAGFTAFYAAVRWAWSNQDPAGRFFWFISTGAFACGACLRGLGSASLAWGLALLLPGAIFSLFPRRDRRWLWLPYISILTVSAVPFSPLWFGTSIYDAADLWAGLPFPHNLAAGIGLGALFVAQALLLGGYVRQVVNSRITPQEPGMWQSLGDFSGNLLLVVVYLSLGGWMALSGQRGTWLPSAAVIVLTALLAFFQIPSGRRLRLLRLKPAADENAIVPITEEALQPSAPAGRIRELIQRIKRVRFSPLLAWIPPFLYRSFYTTQRFFLAVSRTLEGQGGVLWALLIFMLLISFIFRPPEAN